MSSTNPSKRRRLSQSTATATLSKPFKSPLRRSSQQNRKLDPTNDHHVSETPITLVSRPTESAPAQPGKENEPPRPQARLTTIPSTPARKQLATYPSSAAHTSPPRHIPTAETNLHSPTTSLAMLQKQHTHLLTTLSSLKAETDTYAQALKIEKNPSADEELEELIVKWKAASRVAAEEVYAGARDRVNRMGGLGALREKEREGRERFGAWDREGGVEGGGNGGEEEEDGRCERLERRAEEAEELAEREKAKEKEKEDEEAGFTMGTMLKQLNVEVGVIGYDEAAEMWVD